MGAADSERGFADVEDRLLDAIRSAGLDLERGFSAEALGALDHFHTGGRRATAELLEPAELDPRSTALDIGAGIGGPARWITSRWGCRVVCLEPSEDLCRAARLLNRLTHLQEQIDVHAGGAPPIPFPDESFDVVVMQNVGMCIANKPELYHEIARVLRPGGRFLFQEYVTGPVGEPYFPVPWADQASSSFLLSAGELRRLPTAAGLTDEVFEDVSEAELGRPSAGSAQGPLTLGVYVPDFATKSRNARRSLEEGRIRLINGSFRKPGHTTPSAT